MEILHDNCNVVSWCYVLFSLYYQIKTEAPKTAYSKVIVPGHENYEEVQTFEHPMNPKFALSGDLRKPKPGYKLGNIKTGESKVVIGIPTVKVCVTKLKDRPTK